MSDKHSTAGALFQAGHLDDAIAAANQAVRRAPTDLGARVLLAELLLFGGNLERADVILDAAGQSDPSAAMVVAEFRQLLRADMARRQWRREGRVPEVLEPPAPAQQALLAAWVAFRNGDISEAASQAHSAETQRPRVPGHSNDTKFDDFRDADDLFAGIFEVLTTTGKYYWIPTERIESVEFHPPRRPRDLAWRRATMSVADGPDGDVYVPAIYVTADTTDDQLRLGRATDWSDGPLVFGQGQRTFLIGDEAVGIMALTRLTFGA
jgi:type VI secretion system protein ImpE